MFLPSLLLTCSLAADRPAPLVPDEDLPALLDESVRGIHKALDGKPVKRAGQQARVVALMLAAYAQQDLAGKDGVHRATVRDAAVALADTIKGGDYAAALKQADALAKLTANPKASRDHVKLLGPQLDIEEVMSQFRPPKPGDPGLESQLDELAGSKDAVLSADALASLRLTAYQCAVAADLSRDHVPSENAAAWPGMVEAMRKASVELTAAIKAKDGKAAFVAVGRLNTSCRQCHKTFR
jgi:hypothetical protein